jgi:putative DNA primase/helicase
MIPEALIAKARDVRIEDELARRGVRLRRDTKTWLSGPCLKCGGTDRFSINTVRQFWNCRVCDVGGDVIRLVEHIDGISFVGAVNLLAGERGDEARSQARAPDPAQNNATRNIERALELWRHAIAPRGTPVEAYLQSRALQLPPDPARVIRFHHFCPFGKARLPCMLALVRNIRSNEAQAIVRTAFNADGSAQKNARGKTARLSLGPVHGGAIMLSPPEEIGWCLGVAEGMETALSIPLLPEAGPMPVWSLTGIGGYSWLPPFPASKACGWRSTTILRGRRAPSNSCSAGPGPGAR